MSSLRRHALEHQPTTAPTAAAPGAPDRQLDPRLDLLRLPEIVLRAFGEGRAGELDDALIAVGILTLIDGEGNVARPDETGHRAHHRTGCGERGLELCGVVLGVAAQTAHSRDLGDDRLDRPGARGLQR